jgi:hypothetical protein
MASVKEIPINFRIGMSYRRVSVKKMKADIYILPSGEEVFIATSVWKLIACCEGAGILDDQRFNRIMVCIDESGSDRPMVPVSRIGAGPTEKSARFSVSVIQKINDGLHGPENKQKEKKLTFTLPVSQIENVGNDLMAAPLWLILEKLKDKANSKWGAKSRRANSVKSEFVPATLRATTSPRVLALKAWLTSIRNDIVNDEENRKIAANLEWIKLKNGSEEFFQRYLDSDKTDKTIFSLKIGFSKAYGPSDIFQKKVREYRLAQQENSR